MLKKLAAAGAIALAAVIPSLAFAQAPDTTVDVGTGAFNLLNIYIPVAGTAVALGAAWFLNKFLGMKLDAAGRDAMATWVSNQVGAFLAQHKGQLDKVKIDVRNETIAELADTAIDRIPDTLRRFKLGPEDLRQRIVEGIGKEIVKLPAPTPPAS